MQVMAIKLGRCTRVPVSMEMVLSHFYIIRDLLGEEYEIYSVASPFRRTMVALDVVVSCVIFMPTTLIPHLGILSYIIDSFWKFSLGQQHNLCHLDKIKPS